MNKYILINANNSILISILFGFLMLFSMTAVAAEQTISSSNHTLSPDHAKAIHEDLRQLRGTLEKAMNENDVETILANVDENVIFSTMNADVVKGRKNLGEYYKKMMQGPDKIIDSISSTFVADDLSVIHEDDLAIAHGHSESLYKLTVGKTLEVDGIWSSTLIRRDDSWKIASFSYSVNIFDNPILNAQSKLLWMVGAGGGLLALITFLLGRRRK